MTRRFVTHNYRVQFNFHLAVANRAQFCELWVAFLRHATCVRLISVGSPCHTHIHFGVLVSAWWIFPYQNRMQIYVSLPSIQCPYYRSPKMSPHPLHASEPTHRAIKIGLYLCAWIVEELILLCHATHTQFQDDCAYLVCTIVKPQRLSTEEQL